MNRLPPILLTIFSLLGCRETAKPDETSKLNGSLDSIAVNQVPTTENNTKTDHNIKTIPTIIAFIDSLYEIQEPSTDTITNFKTKQERKAELGPLGLDLTDVQEYYRHLSWDFLTFKDISTAKEQFKRVVEVSDTKISNQSDPNRELFLKLFSKAGSAYALYNRMIIYHHRRCNYVEKIQIPKEDTLLYFLFDGKFPDEKYFVRVRCGWSENETR